MVKKLILKIATKILFIRHKDLNCVFFDDTDRAQFYLEGEYSPNFDPIPSITSEYEGKTYRDFSSMDKLAEFFKIKFVFYRDEKIKDYFIIRGVK